MGASWARPISCNSRRSNTCISSQFASIASRHHVSGTWSTSDWVELQTGGQQEDLSLLPWSKPLLDCWTLHSCALKNKTTYGEDDQDVCRWVGWRRARQAPVDHKAQITNTGWNNSRMALAESLFKPNALTPLTYWEMFPQNMATKNSATAQPICTRYFQAKIRPSPSKISTTPDANTTTSA